MSLVKNYNFYRKENVGTFLLITLRFPFRLFKRNFISVYFSPDLPEAGWYEIDLRDFADDELLEKDGPFAAMAYLRSKHNDLLERMVKFNSP